MSKKTMNDYVALYKEQLTEGDIQIAYKNLVRFVMQLKRRFMKEHSSKFTMGNISHGYMDFTYFSYFNPYLRDEKLRFGIVLNHEKLRFELWLMGQNADVMTAYWDLLKETKWNEERSTMPRYSVLEVILAEDPDFSNLEALMDKIVSNALSATEEIIDYLQK